MSKRILIVEDEDDNLGAIADILLFLLKQESLVFARDGHEAIRKVYEARPDLILLDLSIPKLSGWEVARSLKSDPVLQQVPILALTAHAMVGDREKAMAAGCDAYFTKPIDIDAFIAFVEPYLS
ncbi:MAG: response regulator [Anaerolineales bacterium]|nr:response regulator [Anaerolineales bacterium]